MIYWITFDFFIGMVGAFLVAQRGYSWGLIDSPNERSSHRIAVPKGGGIGVFLVFAMSAVWWPIALTLWIPACIVSLVSLLGDYRDVSFRIRLAVQIGAASIVSGSLFISSSISEVLVSSCLPLFLFGVLYISATANYYNFMDGINGIAGVTGAIAFFV
jgi:Fuc2NAc and GlcNAc transferase